MAATSASTVAPYSPMGSAGANQVNKRCVHVREHWTCGDNTSNLKASVGFWDAAGNIMLGPRGAVGIDSNTEGGSFTSPLENPLILTGEHSADYIQFTLGSES